ncbi:MAG: hypothetical protein M5U32_13565 [Myxococcota bacterium]|nr:hypothetical protein [Myxococcota bacterium]
MPLAVGSPNSIDIDTVSRPLAPNVVAAISIAQKTRVTSGPSFPLSD